MTQPAKNVKHSASVFKVNGACEHNFKIQGVVATVTVDSYQQICPAVVIDEQAVCRPKYDEHPPLVHPVFPFQ